ncbi:MAG TPA: hypothetical protein PKZ29_01435 [Candidatus Woesebacteria bacterium]|nr:hypothetical protein [Candidatus Woesebacteria bacterium]HOG37567.1 hypothetical protein [Candidatus Woesebacteria bacterium]
MKKILFLILFLFFGLIFNKSILASSNIFGLHLTQTQDIHSAKDVINSNGGDWGWVILVIRTDQLDYRTWQDFFDNCRKYHIIPIIRLATYSDQGNWKIPNPSDIDNLANFLNSLNWPIKTQYVSLFNEVNHGQEWGGQVDVNSYVDLSIYASTKFKSLNSNFFILNGALDLAAPNSMPKFLSAKSFYEQIYSYKPEFFDSIDGLASHSYPNHGFVGKPYHTGQHSILGYQWELETIKKMGVTKDFPVFITETGWPHREGINQKNNFFTTKTTSQFLLDAYQVWSTDNRIQAVTPFIFNYPHPPFDHFSWLDQDEQLYPEYQKVIDAAKSTNSPAQITQYQLYRNQIPFLIFANHEYSGQISLKNTGQSIWGETNFCLQPTVSESVDVTQICTNPSDKIHPGQIKIFPFKFKIKNNISQNISLSWEGLPETEINLFSENSTIYHPKINLWSKLKNLFSKKD